MDTHEYNPQDTLHVFFVFSNLEYGSDTIEDTTFQDTIENTRRIQIWQDTLRIQAFTYSVVFCRIPKSRILYVSCAYTDI